MKVPHLEWNCRRLNEELGAAAPDRKAKPKRGEFAVAGLTWNHAAGPEGLLTAWQDLSETVRLLADTPSPGASVLPVEIRIRKPSGRNRTYRAELAKSGITIDAETVFGAIRALYRIRNRLCLRRAAFLKAETLDSSGAMDPALTYPALKGVSTFSLDYPAAYSEGYLRGVARAGYTGFHLNIHYSVFCRSRLLPEFRNPEAEKNLADLNRIVQAAARFGLDVYLSFYLSPLPGSHPVFRRLPELRGSRMVGTADSYILCSSHPTVRQFYAEQMTDLFGAVPELGGILAISGCEGWLHCHTACAQTEDGRCECPLCRKLEPETAVAGMFNAMGAAVHAVSPEAKFVVWNYGIFAWSDIGAEKLISRLSDDCCVMANFDTGDAYELEGVQGVAFDYSLRCTGPSEPYRKQQKAVRRGKKTFLAKCESGAPLEYCSLPYVPALTRWMRKYEGIRQSAAGALYCWKFLGYNGGLAQELAGMSAAGETPAILNRLAARDFGEKNVPAVLRAWRAFDHAMDYHPFSGPSAGYFKGPFFIGPAQPLFLQEPQKLPECFYCGSRNRTVVFTDLTFAEPFGVPAMLRALTKMLRFWRQGVTVLEGLRGKDAHERAALKAHLSLCRLFLGFLETARSMTEFYAVRDSFHLAPYTPETARKKLAKMKTIAQNELTNAERALTLLRSDPLLGFSAIYRPGITEAMLRYKIEHTKKLIEHELPFKYYSLLFSFNRHPSWTGKEF